MPRTSLSFELKMGNQSDEQSRCQYEQEELDAVNSDNIAGACVQHNVLTRPCAEQAKKEMSASSRREKVPLRPSGLQSEKEDSDVVRQASNWKRKT
jgi:hypothetical protein